MLKLKAIVNQLDTSDFAILEEQLIQNKADNYLFLLRTYKENNLSDASIIKHLNSNSSSFHTLKSRLYNKIQKHLIENISGDKSDILNQLANINKYCYNTPRETAEAILSKLERDLKAYDMSGDLISVYSALKKIHLHTPKYYEYSQLYNKHLAYTMALEKAEELLGSFNRALSQYHMSKSKNLLEILLLIKKETKNIYQLNKSQHIEVIKNIIIIQLHLFTDLPKDDDDETTDDLLASIENIIQKFPNNTHYKIYNQIINFLRYEYYSLINENKKAQGYFDKINDGIKTWLLLDNLCLAYAFLFSKINNYCRRGMQELLDIENQEEILIFDSKNIHTLINLQFYTAVSKFYTGKTREAITIFNDILNNASFKDILHAEIEVKLTLAYLYIIQIEHELATGLLRSIYRKIKAQEHHYDNVIAFSRMLNLLMGFDNSDHMKTKILRLLRLFEFENVGERKILKFMDCELNRLKNSLDTGLQKTLPI